MATIAQIAGITLDEWQQLVGDVALEVDDVGRWLHRIVLFLVGRQNGKSVVLLARIILGLFGLGEMLMLHTAQDRALPRELFEDLVGIIGEVPEFHRRIPRRGIRETNGQERIRLKSGARYMIKAPKAARFRGPSANLIIIDEIREQHDRSLVGAALPSQSAATNPQMWLCSNAGDLNSVELAAQQERGLAAVEVPGSDPGIAYLEWSAAPELDLDDPVGWAQSNPGLGTRISAATIVEELNGLETKDFETERLCRSVVALTKPAIPVGKWLECGGEPGSVSADELPRAQAGISINGEHTRAALALAAKRDGRLVVDVVAEWVDDDGIDLGMVAREVWEWLKAYRVVELAYDRRRSAKIADHCEAQGVDIVRIDATEFVIASQDLLDAVRTGQLFHRNNPTLNDEIRRAGRRTSADSTWFISEPASKGDISGVLAAAFAVNLAYRVDTVGGSFRWVSS